MATLYAGACLAQDTPPPPPPAAGETTEIIVTAQKRSTNIQKTPLAITALSSQEIQSHGVTDLTHAVDFVPSVQVKQANTGAGFYIRGIGSRGANSLPDSPVAVMIDGVLQQRNELVSAGFADLNRIEVLRGPQGTLYGRNANAGVVNIITNDPKLNSYSGAGSVQYGNYNALRVEGMLNLPVGDTAALRAVVVSNAHDGYLSNGLMDAGETLARVKYLYQPTAGFRLLLGAESDRIDSNGPGNVLLPTSSRDDAWEAPDYSSLYTIPSGDTIYCSPNCQAAFNVKNTRLTAQGDWDLGFASFTGILGHQDFKRYYAQPFSGLWETDEATATQDSVELRLASPTGSRLTWVVGTYWLDYDGGGEVKKNYTFDELTELRENDAKTQALFGQITVPVTERFRLTGGLRYTKDDLTSLTASGTVSGGITEVDDEVTKSYDKVTYKLGSEYDLSPTALVYASTSTGLKSGGVNSNGVGYDPEEITAYELGIKNRLLGGKLTLNADAFVYRYTGYQMSYYYYVGDEPVFLTANVGGTTKVSGLEIEGMYRLTPSDRINGSLALQDSAFGSAQIASSCSDDVCTYVDLTGRDLPRVPKTTVTLGYEHTWDLGTGANIKAGLNAQWKDSYQVDIVTFANSTTKAYSLWNANLVYNAPGDKWAISAYVNNITNYAVLEQANTAGSAVYGVIGAPRTYGIRLSGKF
ncbi:MAG: TonB-dependent receptor [Asticcacaulis sp.]|uniref:TonB-dependent receptor n=1 Tax=Asticcacaulis sp. TaxID=1872648 RepID=UPI0039E47366